MCAAAHPAVEDYLDLAAHSIDDLVKLVEWRATAVELATAMVGNPDCVGTDLYCAARVGGAHDALERKGPAPVLPDTRGGIPVHPGIEHGVEIVLNADRFPASFLHMPVEVRQAEFRPEHIVKRPARPRGIAPQRRSAEAGRGGKARSQASLALARNDRVHRQRQRIELRFAAAFDHRRVQPLVLVDIELEQLRTVGERCDFLDRMGGEAGDAEPDAELLRRARDRPLAIAMEGALQGSGAEHEGQCAVAPHDLAGCVDVAHPGEHIGDKVDLVEGTRIARLGDFVIGCPVDIVEHGPRQALLREPAEIIDIVAV